MEQENSLVIAENLLQDLAPKSILTPEQVDRLEKLDWYIDTELPRVMQEGKEIGLLQAQWKHSDRMDKFLYEGDMS